ncbi:hypothetical protein Sgleb_10780 [Streptomyces glebosus]|uniref:Uncharacterized protein n=1 Tax=Streptomyces glebosus TaxID=249580 RepID=A0A640SRZ8_9ACTN|nr:hypothetical protein Sgleb_10780 [Streptomyces glebosus]GHG56741.1 hypothetical protein GCM10010513_19630 [Streptomyces glebosus]
MAPTGAFAGRATATEPAASVARAAAPAVSAARRPTPRGRGPRPFRCSEPRHNKRPVRRISPHPALVLGWKLAQPERPVQTAARRRR